MGGVALLATGMSVGSGVLIHDVAPAEPTSASTDASVAPQKLAPLTADESRRTGELGANGRRSGILAGLGDRGLVVSRSASRTAAPDPAKAARLDQQPGGQSSTTTDLSQQDPRAVARQLLPSFGFAASEFSCLDSLYVSESDWDVHADNPTSDAYGIPQALPGSKMASAGADWATNPTTQIRWGLGYIKSSYGTPCSAWSFKQSHGWY